MPLSPVEVSPRRAPIPGVTDASMDRSPPYSRFSRLRRMYSVQKK